MSNKKIKKTPKQKTENQNNEKKEMKQVLPNEPWISMRSGLIIITFTSIFMAVLTAMQVWSTQGPVKSILYGLVFGALIWGIFWGYYYFRRFLGRKG